MLQLGTTKFNGASDECIISCAIVSIYQGKYVKQNTLHGIKAISELTKL